MFTLSATCVAIALAAKAGTLSLEEKRGRFGTYIAISDDVGLIEVASSWEEAQQRVASVTR